MDFFKQLEAELQPQIDKILMHPFIERIKDGWLNKAQLQYFAMQYGVYCRYFPRFLAASSANVPDDPTRMALIENLWEEHGEGVLSKSHRILYANFANALGVTNEALEQTKALPTTEICVENLMSLCKDKHFLVSLGALGPGTEFFTNSEYSLIESGLKTYDFLSESDIEFWTVHISLDEHHYSDMVDAIRKWAETEEQRDMIREGAHKALALEYIFWEGLEDNLPHR
jgi:pyrroloquinoline-quinone synthase